MTYPNPGVVRQLEKLASRIEESVRAAPGEIGASRADIYVKDRVTDEHIVCEALS